MIMDKIQWIRARLEGSPVNVPLHAPLIWGLILLAVDMRLPPARRGLLGCVGDGRATGHHRRIVDASDLPTMVE